MPRKGERQARVAAGRCGTCGKNPLSSKAICDPCLEYNRRYQRRLREENPEKERERERKRWPERSARRICLSEGHVIYAPSVEAKHYLVENILLPYRAQAKEQLREEIENVTVT